MNPLENEILEKANFHAQNLLEIAYRNEPEITVILAEIAQMVSAEIVGLEHRFKTEESLTRKIAETSVKNVRKLLESDYFSVDTVEQIIETRAKHLNDALRYTFVFTDEKYIFGFKSSLQKLKQVDFIVPKNKIWNAWKNIGTLFDKGYRGINTTVFSSQGQVFELQFHTRASFELKTETHFLYEELRLLGTSNKRKDEIVQKLIEMAQTVKIPKGVKKL